MTGCRASATESTPLRAGQARTQNVLMNAALQDSLYERIPLRNAARPGRIVIRRSAMDFEQPIVADFTATALAPAAADWEKLLATLRRGRMGRIVVRSVLECDGARVGEFGGEFAVIPS